MNRKKRHKGKRQPRPQHAPASQATIVVGRNPAIEVLRRDPKRIKKAYISAPGEKDTRFQEVYAMLQEHNIPFEETDTDTLQDLSETKGHQGIVLEVSPRQSESLEDVIEQGAAKQRSCIVVCDTLYDPRNLGSIFRAAECFGVDALLWSKNRGTGITPVVSKTSAGASELVPFIEVSNTARAIDSLKDAGYWVVVADVGPESELIHSFQFPEKTVLILGSEGAGVRSLLLKKADFRVTIPMSGSIDSLNVSQAASVLFYAYACSVS